MDHLKRDWPAEGQASQCALAKDATPNYQVGVTRALWETQTCVLPVRPVTLPIHRNAVGHIQPPWILNERSFLDGI